MSVNGSSCVVFFYLTSISPSFALALAIFLLIRGCRRRQNAFFAPTHEVTIISKYTTYDWISEEVGEQQFETQKCEHLSFFDGRLFCQDRFYVDQCCCCIHRFSLYRCISLSFEGNVGCYCMNSLLIIGLLIVCCDSSRLTVMCQHWSKSFVCSKSFRLISSVMTSFKTQRIVYIMSVYIRLSCPIDMFSLFYWYCIMHL